MSVNDFILPALFIDFKFRSEVLMLAEKDRERQDWNGSGAEPVEVALGV
jgi:hypothetical protein